MRRAVVASLVMVGSASAHADETSTSLVERYGKVDTSTPGLVLDPMFRPGIETVGMKEEHHTTQVDLFGTQVIVDGVERASERDAFTRGYRAQLTLSRDLGFARLTAGVALDHLQSSNLLVGNDNGNGVRDKGEGEARFGAATYVEYGAALTRTFKISRENTGWISLALSRRQWLGDRPPTGEQDSTQLMLWFGFTF